MYNWIAARGILYFRNFRLSAARLVFSIQCKASSTNKARSFLLRFDERTNERTKWLRRCDLPRSWIIALTLNFSRTNQKAAKLWLGLKTLALTLSLCFFAISLSLSLTQANVNTLSLIHLKLRIERGRGVPTYLLKYLGRDWRLERALSLCE